MDFIYSNENIADYCSGIVPNLAMNNLYRVNTIYIEAVFYLNATQVNHQFLYQKRC